MPYHNPYNFVRTPARDSKVLSSPFAGDYDPSLPEREENFSRYWPERYTGEFSVRLRTVTPLFITDPRTKKASEQVRDHYIYDCMKELPATTLKGMLSSAYEIITNSRYRIFSEKQHSKRLGFRYNANASLVPGRINEKNGKFSVMLFSGTSKINSSKPDGPLYAAWLPAYKRELCVIPNELYNGLYCENVELGLYSYDGGKFKLWCVKNIGGKNFQPISSKISSTPEKTIKANGYVVISGKTINRKHDERFFFNESGKIQIELSISDTVKKRYEDLIADYQRIHEIINGREQNPVNDPNNEGIIFGQHIEDPAMLNLKNGDFVYVKTDGISIEALYPVQISRELHEISAWECLDKSLKPAENISELSPADRLFGWISQNGTGSWKGKLQITSAKYESLDENLDPVEYFEKPLILSILGEPKPSQARFYLGKKDGSPQNNGISKKEAAYTKGKHIRGRKIYLHHTLHYLKKDNREEYWRPFANDGLRREYNLSQEETNQNRSISGWIPPKRNFIFTVRVENLTREELGALLTLFSIDNECCFRLGYGKPLGLGSVRLSINGDIQITTGRELSERYRNIKYEKKYKLSESEREICIKAYQKAMAAAYSTEIFDDVKAPEVLNFKEDLYDLLNDDKLKENLHEVWLTALNQDQDTPPIDNLPEKEILTELFSLEYFNEKYAHDLTQWRNYTKQYRKNDYGWRKLDFIQSFFDSMRGFKEPVMYPLSSKNDKGFEWFTQNEKITNGRCTGYSLPVIGQTLEEL